MTMVVDISNNKCKSSLLNLLIEINTVFGLRIVLKVTVVKVILITEFSCTDSYFSSINSCISYRLSSYVEKSTIVL